MLGKLTPAMLQQFYADLVRRGVSARTRKHVHANLFSALKAAVRLELVPRNVAEAVDAPRYSAPDVRPLSEEQVAALVEAAKATSPRMHAMILLAVSTGLRQGELFALDRVDLDLRGRVLSVRGTLQPDGTISEPKTAQGRRRLDLSANVLAALNDHLTATPTAPNELLFRSPDGTPLRKSNFIRRDWQPLLKRAGLPPTKWHTLRHTSATLHLARGVHPKVVQELLGHSSIEMTLDIYSSVTPGMGRAAVDGLDSLLGG
jgi:integrase